MLGKAILHGKQMLHPSNSTDGKQVSHFPTWFMECKDKDDQKILVIIRNKDERNVKKSIEKSYVIYTIYVLEFTLDIGYFGGMRRFVSSSIL